MCILTNIQDGEQISISDQNTSREKKLIKHGLRMFSMISKTTNLNHVLIGENYRKV